MISLVIGVLLTIVVPASAAESPKEATRLKPLPSIIETQKQPATNKLLPIGTSESWLSAVQRGLAEREYHPSKNKQGLQAPNRAHNLRTYFEPTGIRLLNRTEKGRSELLNLSLTGIGKGTSLAKVPPGKVTQSGTKVEIRRPGMIEWYENSAKGLEQGFTLNQRLKGEGPLVLELAVGKAQAALHNESIVLTTELGRKLQYGKLIVQDARGKIVSAHLEVPSPKQIRLVVQDVGAHYPLIIDPLITGIPDTILESNQTDDGSFDAAVFGGSIANAGDVNGDGFDDVIVGARGWDHPLGLFDEGAAFVFLGSLTGIETTPHTIIQSTEASAEFGVSVAGAGDVNNDGFGDIIVGANLSETTQFFSEINPSTGQPWGDLEVGGAAYVFYGGPSGILATDPSMADAKITGNQISSFLGFSVAGAGDVNGDLFDDIIVGVPRHQSPTFPPNISPNQGQGTPGAALVFHGSAAGITWTGFDDADAALFPYPAGSPEPSGTLMGADVSGAGDVNGDGFADVILGLGFYDVDQLNEGATFVFHGEPAPINPNQPPVANAGADQTVFDLDDNGSEEVTLDGTASFDPDGTIVSYAWFEGETLLGTTPVLTTALTTTGNHTIVLTVTDDAGLTRGDPVVVRVDLVPSVQILNDGFTTGFGFAPWVTAGDVTLSSLDPFPDPPQVRLGATGAFLNTTLAMPAGSTGMTVSFQGKANRFSALDEVLVKVSFNGGPFTTIHTITSAASNNTYIFYGGSAIPIGFSWFPTTASNIVLEFESNMTTGEFFVDSVIVRALQAPLANQPPIANAGADQTVTDTDGNGVETVTLDGTASSDPDGTITDYEWREGATLLGLGSTLATSFGIGAHTVTLTVTDDGGASSSDTVIVTVQNAPPLPQTTTTTFSDLLVEETTNTHNLSIDGTGTVDVNLTWTDEPGEDPTEPFLTVFDPNNSVVASQGGASPILASFTATITGVYVFQVQSLGGPDVNYTLQITHPVGGPPPPDTTPPTTSITSPANGATVSGTITISATASDNVGVTQVQFFVDGGLLSTDTTAPYSATWDTTTVADGAHSLTTQASDAAGNVGTSAAVNVTVSNSGATTFTLTIITDGEGTVTSSPAGINCGANCSEAYASGTVVTLTATPAGGWVFNQFLGDADCTDGVVTMDANKTCTAEFDD